MLGVKTALIAMALLIEAVEVVVACPEQEVIQAMEITQLPKDLMHNVFFAYSIIVRGVPLSNAQPILAISEGLHPLLRYFAVTQFASSKVHIAQMDAIPEAEAII